MLAVLICNHLGRGHSKQSSRLLKSSAVARRLACTIAAGTTAAQDSIAWLQVPEMTEILGDDQQAAAVVEAAKTSMGQDISPIDLINIETFAKRVISLAEYR